MSKKDLLNAKKVKQNEFYTLYDDIQAELNHYVKHFKNKVVFCNCDDPYESNFFKFFAKNFNFLGLKRLICTCYINSPVAFQQLTLYDDLDNIADVSSNGYLIDINEIPSKNGKGITDDDILKLLKSKRKGVKKLEGDGDFRSEEVINYLKQADIVVTNPPFSLFREYVAQLIEYDKKFLIIGNQNAISYKEIFKLIKENKIWLGATIHSGDREFRIPDDYEVKSKSLRIDDQGNRYIRVVGVRWFTNLDYKERHEMLETIAKYKGNEEYYPKYENYDAINVDKTCEIPNDYKGVMGVPITFMDKYNPEQFEIINGIGRYCVLEDKNNNPVGTYGTEVNGEKKYFRVLIKRKK